MKAMFWTTGIYVFFIFNPKIQDMKMVLFFMVFLLAGTVSPIISQSAADKGYRLVWEDEFEGDHFDEEIWSKIPRGKPDWQNLMSDFDSCYAMKDGNLVLRGILNKPEYGLNDTASFLTGGVYSKGKKSFENGRLEIRARIRGSQGAWPAIWLLPEGGHWPQDGEIDIMERLNRESKAYQTVHSHYTYNLKKRRPKPGSTGRIEADGYNVYAVELGPDSLRFYINDRHTFTYPRIDTDHEGQYPFDRPYYLLIDMQLGGSWVGEVDPQDLPAEMWVDRVRFYQKK